MKNMNREKAAEIIKNLPIYRAELQYDRKSDLMQALEMAIESLGRYTNVGSKWIPCSERFPIEESEDGESVLATIQYENTKIRQVKILYYDKKNDVWWIDGCYVSNDIVIAWQPLPEAWKGEYKGE